MSCVLVHSEKYCFLCAIQTKHTVHEEGKERVQNVVLIIGRVLRKVNLIRGRSIQKSDGNREEAFLQSVVGVLRLLYLFPDGRRWKRECPGCVGSLIMLAAFPRQREV